MDAENSKNPLYGLHLIRNFPGCFTGGRVPANSGSIALSGIEPASLQMFN